MSDMQISIRFRRKPGVHRLIYALSQILINYLFNKILAYLTHALFPASCGRSRHTLHPGFWPSLPGGYSLLEPYFIITDYLIISIRNTQRKNTGNPRFPAFSVIVQTSPRRWEIFIDRIFKPGMQSTH